MRWAVSTAGEAGGVRFGSSFVYLVYGDLLVANVVLLAADLVDDGVD